METIGVTELHRLIGVSTTTLHNARKFGYVSKVIELAAAAELRKLENGTSAAPQGDAFQQFRRAATATFLIEVKANQRSMVKQFAEMMGAKLIAAEQ